MPSILIAGLGKTGTTGVYNSFKDAVANLDEEYAFLFEPSRPDPLRSLGRYAPYRPILTKIILHRLATCEVRYTDFDHRIMTVRDPRDVVISRLLFRPLNRGTVRKVGIEELKPFIDALREKEADPTSHSVKGLHDLADKLAISDSGWTGLVGNLDKKTQIAEEHDFFISRYEDFVDNRLEALSEYVGFPVVNPAAKDVGWLSHIPRSMGYGDWRNWFLDEDVEFFGSLFSDYLQRYGYTDWELAESPRVDPAISSEYVEKQVSQRLEEVQERFSKEWTVESVDRPEQVDYLRTMAVDGDADAAYRLAQIYTIGKAVEPDPPTSIQWARESAIRGHAAAMSMLSDLLAKTANGDRSAILESRMWAREHEAAMHERQQNRRIERLENNLEKAQDRQRKMTRQLKRARAAGPKSIARRALGRARRALKSS